MQREGFNNAPDLDTTIFSIESDGKGNLLPIFGEVYDAIERILEGEEGVLMWDVGGGVAVLAAYSKYSKAYALTRSGGLSSDKETGDSYEKVLHIPARGHDGHKPGEAQATKAHGPPEQKNHRHAKQRQLPLTAGDVAGVRLRPLRKHHPEPDRTAREVDS